jgi:hypothetical protein
MHYQVLLVAVKGIVSEIRKLTCPSPLPLSRPCNSMQCPYNLLYEERIRSACMQDELIQHPQYVYIIALHIQRVRVKFATKVIWYHPIKYIF